MTTIELSKFMEAVKEREEEMAALRKKGYTLLQIGDKYGISMQRVHQILERMKRERKRNPAFKETFRH